MPTILRPRHLFLLLTLAAPAQPAKLSPAPHLTPIPAGLTLPIRLDRTLKAGATPSGTAITATTTQRIPISPNTYLPPGLHVLGTVVTSTTAGGRSTLTLRFTTLTYRSETEPLRTRALAIANFTDVADTHAPANGSTDRGNPSPASWTTRQVGGDQVARSGWVGEVVSATTQHVGFADYNGIYADPAPAAPGIPRALGVFSSTAHGLYGFDDQTRLDSTGPDITLTAPGKLTLHNGDNLLLELLPTPSPRSPESREQNPRRERASCTTARSGTTY